MDWHAQNTASFFFLPLTQMKLEHITKSVPAAPAAESPQAAQKNENSPKVQSFA